MTANEELVRASLRRATALIRRENAAVRSTLRILREDEDRIVEILTAHLAAEITATQIQAALKAIREQLIVSETSIEEIINTEVREVVKEEHDWLLAALFGALALSFLKPKRSPLTKLRRKVSRERFDGQRLAEHHQRISNQRYRELSATVWRAYDDGQDVASIIRAVRGTSSRRFKDGTFRKARNRITPLVRAAVQHASIGTRAEVFTQNRRYLAAQLWLSIMDDRTSIFCWLRNRRLYTVGTNPEPIGHTNLWGGGPGRLHWYCRSTSVPVLKSYDELKRLSEFRDSNRRIDETDLRNRLPVKLPEPEVAEDELRTGDFDVVVDLLGKRRAELFVNQRWPLTRFFNRDGDLRLLSELNV